MPMASAKDRADALAEEIRAIRGDKPDAAAISRIAAEDFADRAFAEKEKLLRKAAEAAKLSALCLSGGGIRSAAFCLGVAQALARHGLLRKFDYLSTVSGGGYAGSFVQMLVQKSGGVKVAEHAISEAGALSGLRNYTNYLTPGGGLFSLNTWTTAVLCARNVVLNWVVYLPLILLPVVLVILARTSVWAAAAVEWVQWTLLGLAVVSLAAGTCCTAMRLPDHRRPTGRYASTPDIVHWALWPAFAFAWLGAAALGVAPASDLEAEMPVRPLVANCLIYGYAIALAVGYVIAWIRAPDRWIFWRNLVAWAAATAFSTGIVCIGVAILSHVDAGVEAQVVTVGAPAWLLLALAIHATVFVGVRRESRLFDLDREWLGRLSAAKLRAGILWAGFSFACLSLTWFYMQIIGIPGSVASLVGTLGLGGVAAWIGGQAETKIGALLNGPGSTQGLLIRSLPLLALIFVIGLIALLGRLAIAMLGGVQIWITLHLLGHPGAAPVWLVIAVPFAAAIALLVLVMYLNRRVNVNRYSLHAIYRNRLSRAFLGSARGDQRSADPFTDFDPDDNVPLAALAQPAGGPALFPVVNMTLNLTTGAAAAWSERRALAFTATPLACGAPLLMQFNQGSGTPARGAYWPTASYAGRENLGDAGKGKGLSLATAITISGAAVSPNWGYHSSPLTAFVMTLFNVRLGAWLPNPGGECTQPGRERDMDLAMPRSSLRSLLGDLLGSAAAAGPSVYLSDGGHFENLGLYEMLRRRCRHILVVDAGQDAGCTYEDLGNALRKAAIDMNVTVRFEKEVLICGRNDRKRLGSAAGYAIATIKYPRYPDDATDCEGHLIYMKPTLLGKIPQDVRAFANDNPEFPHESTMDQFFAESRFESYRALGEFQAGEMIARIRAAVPETPEDEDGLGLDTFFEKAFETYPSGKHAADLPLHARVRSSGG